MIIDTKKNLHINLWLKNKKRVVSTLFLFLMLIGCELKSPEKWETPAWYVDFTLPLTNLEITFDEMLNDSTIISDTSSSINHTSDDIIYAIYDIKIPFQTLPDDIFSINAETLGLTVPSLSASEPVNVPITNFSTDIPISFPEIGSTFNGCFPAGLVDSSFPDQDLPGTIDALFTFHEDAIFSVNKVNSDSGHWLIEINNNFPFPIDLGFSLSNGSAVIFQTGSELTNISPYANASEKFDITIDSPETIDLQENLSYQVSVSASENQVSNDPCNTYVCLGGDASILYDDMNCQNQCSQGQSCVEFSTGGWPIQEIPFGVDFTLEYVSKVKSVEITLEDVKDTTEFKQVMASYEGFSIKQATLTNPILSDPDTNMLLLDVTNNSPMPFSLRIEMFNFFNADSFLIDSFRLDPGTSISSLDESGQINFSGYTLSSVDPNGSDPLTAIDSLAFLVIYGLDGTTGYTIEVVDGQISLGVDFNGFKINNICLDHISAITENMEIPVTESGNVEGLPEGMSNVKFEDMILEMELFNEIGIPVDMDFDIIGIKEGLNDQIFPLETSIGVPDPTKCTFDKNNIVRTLITSNKDSIITEYYCPDNSFEDTVFVDLPYEKFVTHYDGTEHNKSLIDIINFIPEMFGAGGEMIIDGEGELRQKSGIWGNFKLVTPLSFTLGKPMTIIPSSITNIDPMDASTVEQIDSTMVEASLYAKITNRSSAGGSFSILISDSTIFPLFLDSLITGSWNDNLDYQQSNFGYQFYNNPINQQPLAWDSLGINVDSISVLPLDDVRSREVKFFRQGDLQFFVGRLITLDFFPAEINDEGYADPEFPGIYTSVSTIDTSLMSWLITTEPRKSNVIITFNESIENEGIYDFITLQTINLIEIQTMLTLKLDTKGFSAEEND